ncbi:OmpW family protein [Pseudomaricurvus sp. HS19]|uniref:OmpW/AlkL family protein n=1 Tax=Pseudomaricurvus sp. HS19 TaxID=2692626 RepID=UPI00136BFDAC|nr:OmpW family outer membrane protein [Pseudomaricurvus sp. HS19]MYM62768.1 outer membrane beta-barrel protein [Pseudomaricurvus sp. HS19]
MNKVFKHLSLAAAVSCATFAMQANAYEAGDWIVRAGVAHVAPDDSSDPLALNGGAISGSEVEVDSDTQLGLTVTYMINSDFGVELLAATPFTHDITADTGALGLGKVDAGETSHLPPTLSAVWYPMGSAGQIAPYVGAGINYTMFFEEDVSSDLEGVLGSADLELDDSIGLALQVGVDVQLNDNWQVNASLRWIDIDTDAEITAGANTITIDNVEIDPWVYQLNVGYKF